MLPTRRNSFLRNHPAKCWLTPSRDWWSEIVGEAGKFFDKVQTKLTELNAVILCCVLCHMEGVNWVHIDSPLEKQMAFDRFGLAYGFWKDVNDIVNRISNNWLPYWSFLTYSNSKPATEASKFNLDRHEWIPYLGKKKPTAVMQHEILRGCLLRLHELF